jgi:aminoglycoside phosphotransferase family enzyme
MIMEQAVLELPRNLLNQVGEIAKSHGVEIDTLVQQILKDYLRTQATPPLSRLEKSRAIHEEVKANIAEKYPHLKKQRSKKEVQECFDNITEKFAGECSAKLLKSLKKP